MDAASQPTPYAMPQLSLARGDVWYRLQQAARSVPREGKDGAMRIILFSYRSLLNMALPVALPILAVGAIEIPVADLVGKILKTAF